MNYNEERKIVEKLRNKYREMETAIEQTFDKDVYEYILRKNNDYQNRNYKNLPDSFGKSLRLHLDGGGRPSEFFKKNINRLKGYIPENLLPSFYRSLDSVNEWQVSYNYYNRRSYRGKNDYTLYMERYIDIIDSYRYLADYMADGYDIYALVKEEVPENMSLYIRHERSNYLSEYYIASRLDEGDEKLEQALTNVIYGDTGSLNIYHIRGIFMSHNERMFELLSKTLLAAKLSEGLRQVICENMDYGTKEGFLYIFKTIEDNNLIRFSSVKRAIATFTGLFAYDSKDIDRISTKNLDLMGKVLSDDSAIEEVLRSEDSMEIYLGLWAIGFVDAKTAFERASKLSKEGSRHQRLVASYFVAHSAVPYATNDFAKEMARMYRDDDEMLAIIMRIIMANVGTRIYNVLYPKGYNRYNDEEKQTKVYTDWRDYFESAEECREFSDLLYEILGRLPKKGHKFEPCVFPWYTAVLSPSDLVVRIVFCASALKDNELMEKAASMIKDISSDSGDRIRAIDILLREPNTPILLDMLTQEVGDADTSARSAAYRILKVELEEDRSKLPSEIAAPAGRLPERSYMILEDMLRLKRADLRSNVLNLLATRGPEEKIEMLKRLFQDGKEEKVTAGLDIIMQLKKSEDETFAAAAETIELIQKPTTKEKILIDEIVGKDSSGESVKQEPFYIKNATYDPVVDEDYIAEALEAFYKLFPDSNAADVINPPKNFASKFKTFFGGKKNKASGKVEIDFIKALDDLIEANKDREYNCWNGPVLLGTRLDREYVNGRYGEKLPFLDLWDDFLDKHNISDGQLLSLYLMSIQITSNEIISGYLDYFRPLMANLFSPVFTEKNYPELKYRFHIHKVLEYYIAKRDFLKENNGYITAITALYLNRTKESTEYTYKTEQILNDWRRKREKPGDKFKKSIFEHPVIEYTLRGMRLEDRNFPIYHQIKNGIIQQHINHKSFLQSSTHGLFRGHNWMGPHAVDSICAVISGYISKDFMYKTLLDDNCIKETLSTLSSLIKYIYESDIKVSNRRRYSWYRNNVTMVVGDLLRRDMENVKREDLTEVEEQKLKLAEECYEKISKQVLDTELVRGDTETEYSRASLSLDRVYGVENLVRILGALGEETLDRTTYFYSYGSNAISKRESLSHLLAVCIPDPREGDSAEQAKRLKELVKNTDIKEKRLIEAGLYSPEWLPIINEYLGWDGFMSGCYYFMAHMNEKFDDKRKAIIAKYTPLSEEELNGGAFDINWFNEVYKTLGKKRFDEIYKAAKYISDGGKHTRARKYADASRGEMDPVKTAEEIEKKRNKDLLMAYALIPCTDKEKIDRYSFIQKYIKGSKQFGAQRRASEKAAAEMAIKNMATASGFSDETRFILKMERELSSGLSMFFEPHEIDEYTVWLEADDSGKMSLMVKKGEKTLKSVPAGLKKNEYIVDINDAKKTFTEQYRRTRIMMEEAMESETEFFVSEILDMSSDRVVGPMINKLLFKQGDFFGFPEDIKAEGLKADSSVVVAHPYHLFEAGRWHEFQKVCFDEKIKQPFKQIFRELYVKTEEEKNAVESMRYAGNQINPKMTVGVLRNRRWVADAEEGLQKIYYKENIIATIYALADWFAPSDIEAPTLEWVAFYDRKTFENKPVSEIPDIIFSEVMRDVDLAVSVAHAGGIDPEMSHSTIEMRRAIAEFLVPMFKLKNVTFTDSHVKIQGTRGNYNIHLGSGVIHQEGGPMINVLPVHSQHRGRIFLPFVDDDPKTSEIMSKIIFFAEDKKIKDPFILDQIV